MGLLVASFVLLLTIQSLHLCSAEDSASINRLGEALDGRFGDLTAKTTNGQFGPWSAFTACSRSCGGGTKKRTRICLHGKTCRGPTHEQQTCNAHLCGSAALGGSTILRGNSRWNEWADWTACTKTCGGGEQTRFRSCLARASCLGAKNEERKCNTGSCPFGSWNQWTAWTVCDAACGTGQQRRTRLCIGGNCAGNNNEVRHCSRGTCAGDWNEWSAFSPCDKTCGGGKEIRRRVCTGGSNCVGNGEEVRVCNSQPCSRGQWSNWSAFVACTQTCGGGSQIRRRTCTGGGACPGNVDESRTCNSQSCPKGMGFRNDASWSPWTPFSPCSVTCGTGFETRKRNCVGIGAPCPGLDKEQRPCNRPPCSIGKWTSWTAWTPCTQSCKGGNQRRSRVCQGGVCAGDNNEARKCNVQSCTAWSTWRDVGVCSRTCGQSGVKRRTRVCPSGTCVGPAEDFIACNRVPC